MSLSAGSDLPSSSVAVRARARGSLTVTDEDGQANVFEQEWLSREGSQWKARSAGSASTGLVMESPTEGARPKCLTGHADSTWLPCIHNPVDNP